MSLESIVISALEREIGHEILPSELENRDHVIVTGIVQNTVTRPTIVLQDGTMIFAEASYYEAGRIFNVMVGNSDGVYFEIYDRCGNHLGG